MTLGDARLETVLELVRQGLWPWELDTLTIEEMAAALKTERERVSEDKS